MTGYNPGMTGIDTLLQELDVNVAAFAVCEVRAGWHLDAPGLGAVSVHYVLQGHGRLCFGNGGCIDFAPRGVVICPPGVALRMSVRHGERPDATHCAPVRMGLEWLRSAGGSELPRVLIACGTVSAATGLSRGMFDSLATPVHLPVDDDRQVSRLFDQLLDELAAPALGSRALSGALMKQGLILMLRRLSEQGDDRLPWLRSLDDPGLAAAVNTMLADPARRLSIEQLADTAHTSRTTFIHRFKRAFGMPPQRFLAEQRLRHAARLLRATDYPVKTIAAAAGYRSRSHFSKAFKAQQGLDPESYRNSVDAGTRVEDGQ